MNAVFIAIFIIFIANYCDEYACLFVYLFVCRLHISEIARLTWTEFFVRVTCKPLRYVMYTL